MTDRPILFSAPMVRALLDGCKTQTRRIIDFPGIDKVIDFVRVGFDKDSGAAFYEMKDAAGKFVSRPKGKNFVDYHYSPRFAVGDRLWVRESHHRTNDSASSHLVGYDFADGPITREDRHHVDGIGDVQFFRHSLGGWGGRTSRNYPGIHMPRWASRLTLTVTDVRVQRLHDISDADAIAEGIVVTTLGACREGLDEPEAWATDPDTMPVYFASDGEEWTVFRDPRDAYLELWDQLNDERGFGSRKNPWAVAVTFTPILGNIDQVRS